MNVPGGLHDTSERKRNLETILKRWIFLVLFLNATADAQYKWFSDSSTSENHSAHLQPIDKILAFKINFLVSILWILE